MNLFENLEYKALTGMVKPLIMLDEFESKMGAPEDIVTISFYVRDQKAARDLMRWFEGSGPDVLDAETSPGEIKPNRYLVYVEIRRRSNCGKIVARMLEDLESLTEFKTDEWEFEYEDRRVPFSVEAFDQIVPLSPQRWRETHEKELNEWRELAGLEGRRIYDSYCGEVRQMQAAAGIV